MSVFEVSILAADNVFYEGPCESLIVPTSEGQYGVLAHHSNTICAVFPGLMVYKIPGQPEQIASVSGGLIKIENNEVLVLVDSAERPEEIDENRARRDADEAKEALLQKRSMQEAYIAKAQLARAISRKRVKNNYDNQ